MKLTNSQTSLIGLALRTLAEANRKDAAECRKEPIPVNLHYASIFDEQAKMADSMSETFDDMVDGADVMPVEFDK